ncbi:MAG TPA: xanthine dehydrogenase family protein molybdopterin-binding subunit, partial [Gemmatimonadaceae bacterium]
MTTTSAPGRLFGARVKRREDPRFITGRGQYTDDITLPGTTHAAFVRSPYAHARITGVDAAGALAMPGVRAVFTGADLADAGVNPIPAGWVLPGMHTTPRRALATDRARYVGEAVAVVIADTAAAARDAAERVRVDYEELPAVADATRALAPGAPLVHDDAPENRCFHWTLGDAERTDAAIRGAAHVVRHRLVNQRLVPNAIEPRASLGSYHAATDELTLWVTSQNPHVHRLIMCAFVLGIPEHKLRVIAPDVGGGFGSKIYIYPEEIACLFAAKRTGRPVKWVADRSESFMTDAHGRDHVTKAKLALDADHRFIGLKVDTIANIGAYMSLFSSATPTYLYACLLAGQYTTPAIYANVKLVYSHTTPVDAYRGAGRPEATFVVERLVEAAARKLGVSP